MKTTLPRILIISYYWPPAGGPGVQRWLKLSKYLAELGAEVHVLTVHPDQATWPIRDEALLAEVHPSVQVHFTSTFEPFGAYLKTTGRKEVPYSGFANEVSNPGFRQRAAKFIRGNFFLPDARKGWNRFVKKEVARLMARQPADVLITTGPPQSTHLAGKWLSQRYRLPWIADFRDPWTDIYYYDSLYPTRLARWIDKRWERQVLQEAKAVLASSPYLTQLLEAKVEKEGSFYFFPNGFDPSDFPASPPEIKRGHLVYTGTIAAIYPLDGLIQAVANLPETNWHFDLFGKSDETTDLALEQSAFDYHSHGFVSHREAVAQMHAAHALLLVIPKMNPNKGIIPGKIFEYIGSGRPILGIGPVDSDAAQIVRSTGRGAFFDYDDATGMQLFLQDPEAYLKEASTPAETYSRSGQAQQLLQLIRQLQPE